MELCDKVSVILKIADIQPNIGKTAIMKCEYFLQSIKNVPLDYEFEIYTYGPYSSAIMEEVDFARQEDLLEIKHEVTTTGLVRYSINCKEKGKALYSSNEYVKEFEESITEIARAYGSKTARELELLSTIHYIGSHFENKDKEVICSTVSQIKPRFSIDEIKRSYDDISIYFCA